MICTGNDAGKEETAVRVAAWKEKERAAYFMSSPTKIGRKQKFAAIVAARKGAGFGSAFFPETQHAFGVLRAKNRK